MEHQGIRRFICAPSHREGRLARKLGCPGYQHWRWRLPEQRHPLSFLSDSRQNYATVAKEIAVLEDQATKGQVLRFAEAEAAARYLYLVVASLRAMLFDGTNGLAVDTRTRIRDQGVSDLVGFEAGLEGECRLVAAYFRTHNKCERSSPAGASTSFRLEVPRSSC